MKSVLINSWACRDIKYTNVYQGFCYEHKDISLGQKIIDDIQKLEFLSIRYLTSK